MENLTYIVYSLNIQLYGKTIPFGILVVETGTNCYRLDIIDTPDATPWKILLKNIKTYSDFLSVLPLVEHPLSVTTKSIISTKFFGDIFWNEVEKKYVEWAEETPWE